jgi:hypothetical protein
MVDAATAEARKRSLSCDRQQVSLCARSIISIHPPGSPALPNVPVQKNVFQRQLPDLGMPRFETDGWSRQIRLGLIVENTRRPLRKPVFQQFDLLCMHSNCRNHDSTAICSLRMAASATFALKAGLRFRHSRLVMVSPVSGI